MMCDRGLIPVRSDLVLFRRVGGVLGAFGANRCMFESNFPPDKQTCSYPVMWNTFKRIVADCSADEKAALFAGTARTVYALDV